MDDRIFLVGGFVRDEILGLTPHDKDYVVVVDTIEQVQQVILNLGGQILHVAHKYACVRARLPNDDNVHDFVMARSDGTYSDARRPDDVRPASLLEDLSRRDFTINAIAKKVSTNEIVDPFSGQEDCRNRILRTVGDPLDRFREDPLRILRAIRFIITKGFAPCTALQDVLDDHVTAELLHSVSGDRIRNEVNTCLQKDTPHTLRVLCKYDHLLKAILPRIRIAAISR